MTSDLHVAALRAASRYRRVGRAAEGWARGKLTRDPAFAAVVARLPDEAHTLLDVGCGEGYLLAMVREVRPELDLLGMDHDPRRLEQGRAALGGEERLRLEVADAREVDLPAADAITCLDVLHYVEPADQDALVGRMAAALLPGGVLLVRDGVRGTGLRSFLTGLSERVLVALGRHRGDGVYLRATEELAAAMEAAGLRTRVEPCAEGTPFSNVLLVGRRA